MQKVIFHGETGNLNVERVRRGAGFDMLAKHFHSNYELYYLLSGNIHYFIENNVYHVSKGTLVLVDSNQIHKTSSAAEQHERILLEIGVDLINSLQKIYPDAAVSGVFTDAIHILPLGREEQTYVEKLLFGMLDELKFKQNGYEALVQVKLMELLIFIMREKTTNNVAAEAVSNSKHQKILEIAEYISVHYNEEINLDTLSSVFYVSKYYLCRIFKEVTGFTVNEYLNVNRIKKAKEMLQQGKYNITYISEATGYSSVTHFDRVFKSYMGVSPLAYRRMQK